MWQKLSLRARLNTILALILTLGLAVNIARLVLEAAPRVKAEDQSVIRLAREFVETLVAGLDETPDPDARLGQIIGDLNRLRHVSITRQEDAIGEKPTATESTDGEPSWVPAWFVALIHPEQTAVSVPISIHDKPESLFITSHPNDEIAEIWDGIVTQLQVGSAIAVALFLITMVVVSRALAPIQALSQGTGVGIADVRDPHQRTRMRPQGEQIGSEFVMQLARDFLTLHILQRDGAPGQLPLVFDGISQRDRKMVQLGADGGQLRRASGLDARAIAAGFDVGHRL